MPDGMAPNPEIEKLPELETGNASIKRRQKRHTHLRFKSKTPCPCPAGDGLTSRRLFSKIGTYFASDSHNFLLIGGNPGTGKSNYINTFIHYLTTNYTPEQGPPSPLRPETWCRAVGRPTARLAYRLGSPDQKIRSCPGRT